MNKTPRQSEGSVSQEYFTLSNKTAILIVKEAMSWVGWWKFYYTRRDRRCKEGRQTNCQNISGAEGAFGLPQKFPVRETNIPSLRFMDENESEWLKSVAMTPQGSQSFLEEKEIVCWE